MNARSSRKKMPRQIFSVSRPNMLPRDLHCDCVGIDGAVEPWEQCVRGHVRYGFESRKKVGASAFSCAPIFRAVGKLWIEGTKRLFSDSRCCGLARIDAHSEQNHELVLELTVIGVARLASRHLPLLKVLRRIVWVPGPWKNVIPRSRHGIL